MDGMELVAGAAGLDRIVSWTYLVQTKPYKDHMNPGNFALLVVDYKRFSMDEAYDAMVELNELGISGFAISVVEDREETPQRMKDKADELKLPLFYIRWAGATFVDIAQSIGELLLETSVDNKRTGDYLYNLLFAGRKVCRGCKDICLCLFYGAVGIVNLCKVHLGKDFGAGFLITFYPVDGIPPVKNFIVL